MIWNNNIIQYNNNNNLSIRFRMTIEFFIYYRKIKIKIYKLYAY